VHFQNVLAPAYEKATGIAIEYQVQAAAAAQCQLVSMVENKSGADLAWCRGGLYRDALRTSDIAEEVGKQQGGWYDETAPSVDKGGKSVPNGNIAS
jgi:hypothetical protein